MDTFAEFFSHIDHLTLVVAAVVVVLLGLNYWHFFYHYKHGTPIEHLRIHLDFMKWAISGVIIILGFVIIRPREQDRLDKTFILETQKAYLAATDSDDVEHWQRKLNIMKHFSSAQIPGIKSFIEEEQKRINSINSDKKDVAAAQKVIDEWKTKYYRAIKESEKTEASPSMASSITKDGAAYTWAAGLKGIAAVVKYEEALKKLRAQGIDVSTSLGGAKGATSGAGQIHGEASGAVGAAP